MAITYSTGPVTQAKDVDQLQLKVLNNNPNSENIVEMTIFQLNGPKQVFTQRRMTVAPLTLLSEVIAIPKFPEFEVQFSTSDEQVLVAVFAGNHLSGQLFLVNTVLHGGMTRLA